MSTREAAISPEANGRLQLDWGAGHGPITGALSATTGCAAAAFAGAAAGMPWGWPAAVGVAGALGHGVGAGLYRRLTGTTVCTRTLSWLMAGSWTSWAVANNPLSWSAMGSLAALGAAVGAMAATAAINEEAFEIEAIAAERRALAEDVGRERVEMAIDWRDRIKRVTALDVQILGIERFPNGAGYWIEAKLPGGRATWRTIAAQHDALAADAELELGCTIAVSEGVRQGRVLLAVCTRPVMQEDVDYPVDTLDPLSILTGIPWALLPTGEALKVYLREACALILGPPGSGKSTLLDVILAGFARCRDVVTWVIDLKAGAVGQPWVRPWLEAQGHVPPLGDAPPPTTRPGVDWLASTPGEALLMLEAVLNVNAFRQTYYQALMAQHNTTLLPVSAQLPQIQIVVDEGAELLSLTEAQADPLLKALGRKLRKIMSTTRAMGARLVLTAVDGNVSALGSTDVRKFSPVRVALTSASADSANLDKLFPRLRLDISQLTARGSGVIAARTAEGFDPTPFKGWRTSPQLVRAIVLATEGIRPNLDAPTAAALGAVYAERWSAERAGWLWGATASGGAARVSVPGTTAPLQPSSERPADAMPTTAVDDLVARLAAEIDATYGVTEEPERPGAATRPTPAAPTSTGDDENAAAAAESSADEGPAWLPAALRVIRAAGPAGMSPHAVAAAVGKDRKTVRPVLQAAAAAGRLIYRENGPRTVYIHPDHV